MIVSNKILLAFNDGFEIGSAAHNLPNPSWQSESNDVTEMEGCRFILHRSRCLLRISQKTVKGFSYSNFRSAYGKYLDSIWLFFICTFSIWVYMCLLHFNQKHECCPCRGWIRTPSRYKGNMQCNVSFVGFILTTFSSYILWHVFVCSFFSCIHDRHWWTHVCLNFEAGCTTRTLENSYPYRISFSSVFYFCILSLIK